MNKKIIPIVVFFLCLILIFFKISFSCLLPAILAITLAFLTHEVYFSLFSGLLLGVISLSYNKLPILSDYTATFFIIPKSFFESFEKYIINAISDKDHLYVLLFTFFIGALVHLIRHSGGMRAIVQKITPLIKTKMHAQLYTFLMGIIIFFDDFANTLIVANAMRPITDKFKVSREKLSFIVDATAAPVASLMMISTWIGYEIGLIQEAFKVSHIDGDAYISFISSVPFRYYGIYMLVFILGIILFEVDFFAMEKAEKKAFNENAKDNTDSETKASNQTDKMAEELLINKNATILHAALPLLILILGVLIGLYITGKENAHNLQEILSNANSYKALLWASITAAFSALFINVFYKKIMLFKEAIDILIKGLQEMFPAAIILILAWSLGQVMKDLHTAQYVSNLLKGNISYHFIPALIFIVSAITSFATGTSWGTMAIMFPIAIPLIKSVCFTTLPPDQFLIILNATIGSILSGAVFGDHCSPISDTTILSSIASKINHIDHVRTQIPYALAVAFISILIGYIPSGFMISPIISFISMLVILLAILFLKKKSLKKKDIINIINN